MSDRITVEVSGMDETIRGIDDVGDHLQPSAAAMRDARRRAVEELRAKLTAAAHRSPTPQAAAVAGALTTEELGELAAVAISSGQIVVSGGGSAGQLLQGSEHGGRNFAAPVNAGGYWIRPTLEADGERVAGEEIQRGVDAAVGEAGF